MVVTLHQKQCSLLLRRQKKKRKRKLHFQKESPFHSNDLFLRGTGDISICCQFLFLFSSFAPPSALLCADWKILSLISLLLPATGAGWRIHARRTMQLRRFWNKGGDLTSAPRLAEQRNCIRKAEKWTTAGGVAQSWLTISHKRACAGPGVVPVLFWILPTCALHRFRLIGKNRSYSMSEVWSQQLIVGSLSTDLFFVN